MDDTNTATYISLADAAENSPYTQEYLSLRARQGKLRAVKQGRNWVTTQAWLDEYINQVDESKHELKEAMVTKPASVSPSASISAPTTPNTIADTEPVHQQTNQYAHYRPYNEVPKTTESSASEAPAVEIPVHHEEATPAKARLDGVEHHPVAISRPTIEHHDASSRLSMDDISPKGDQFDWEEDAPQPAFTHLSPYEAPEEEIEEAATSEDLYHPISVTEVTADTAYIADNEPDEEEPQYSIPPQHTYHSSEHMNADTDHFMEEPMPTEPSWSSDSASYNETEEEETPSERVGKNVLNSLVITACALFFFMAATIFNEPLALTKNITAGANDIASNVQSGLVAVGLSEDTDPQYASAPTYTYDQNGTVAGATDTRPTVAQNIVGGVVTLITGTTDTIYTDNEFVSWLVDTYQLP